MQKISDNFAKYLKASRKLDWSRILKADYLIIGFLRFIKCSLSGNLKLRGFRRALTERRLLFTKPINRIGRVKYEN